MILGLTYITWPALGLTLCVVLGPVSQVKYLVGGGLLVVDLPNKLILLVLGLLEIRWYLVSGKILDQMSRGIRGLQVTAVLGSICTHMAS